MAGVGKNSEARDLPSAELGGQNRRPGYYGSGLRRRHGPSRDARKKRAEKP